MKIKINCEKSFGCGGFVGEYNGIYNTLTKELLCNTPCDNSRRCCFMCYSSDKKERCIKTPEERLKFISKLCKEVKVY